MNKEPIVAIAGATGVIGSEVVSVINDLKLNLGEVRLLASERSVGELYNVLGDEVEVKLLAETDFKGVDIVVLALPETLTQQYTKKALDAGCVVIDTSAHYRMSSEASLIIPSVNIESITKDTKLLACANTCVTQLAPIFKAIMELGGIKRSVVTALQPVASAGKIALDELWDQTMSIFRQAEIESEAFPHQIAFNCFPQIGVMLEDGYSKEERTISEETCHVLNNKFDISVTAVRLPVFHGSSLVLNIETEKDVKVADFYDQIKNIEGIDVIQAYDDYPMPLSVATSSDIVIGRVRQAKSNVLDMWVCADGIRACVAYSVVKMIQQVLKVNA